MNQCIWSIKTLFTFILRSGAQVDWPPLLTRQALRILPITMANVKTLVYFDIEATGLKSSGKPRICELSLIAVNIQDVLSLNLKIKCFLDKDNSESDLRIAKSLSPRIVNKLTICVYPMATIVPLVSDLTGLDNFGSVWTTLKMNGLGESRYWQLKISWVSVKSQYWHF